MDSTFLGSMVDSEKCSKLNMEEKRKLVYKLSKHPNASPEMLLSWSRQDILQILCVEMGKERKYTGLTKLKIIENLLKIVSEKNSGDIGSVAPQQLVSDSAVDKTPKWQRKHDQPSQLSSHMSNISGSNGSSDLAAAIYCENSACKASLSREDMFCKRCSCCICQKFDDNKDPSLWLTCCSDPPFEGESCSMSCHLECALTHERSGLAKNGKVAQLDGSFYCISCGKMNDLLRCWRKQLMIAKEARRVDILCYRVSLSQKLICGTSKCWKLSDIVDEAVNKLQAEVGNLTGIPLKMGRGIVNRMSSGHEVQKLCASAVELLDSMLDKTTTTHTLAHPVVQDSKTLATNTIEFEDICPTSVIVIVGHNNPASEVNVRYSLWHRKAVDEEEISEPTYSLFSPGARLCVSGLAPSTEYVFKVVSFNSSQQLSTCEARLTTRCVAEDIIPSTMVERSQSPLTNCSTLSNPSSVEDETNNITSGLNGNQRPEKFFNYINTESLVVTNLTNGPVDCKYGVDQDGSSLCASNGKLGANNAVSLDQSSSLKPRSKRSPESLVCEAMNTDNGSHAPTGPRQENLRCIPPEMGLPKTPCRMDISETIRRGKPNSSKKDLGDTFRKGEEQPKVRSSTKKRKKESEELTGEGLTLNHELEFYVKMIRRLEREGHIGKSFRQKFLTWLGLRATPEEMRIVKVFVDILRDDLPSLAEQLTDAFEETVTSKRLTTIVPCGFCMKLWH